MKRIDRNKGIVFIALLCLLFVFSGLENIAAREGNHVYDDAKIFSKKEIEEIEAAAQKYGAKRKIEFIILTTKDTGGRGIEGYAEDMYDDEGFGYDKNHGDTAIIAIDMGNRKVHIAGYYKAENYLDNERTELIQDRIASDMGQGNYSDAILTFIETAARYMKVKPGVDPENILLKSWVQLAFSFGIGLVIVSSMLYNSGGKVTTNASTYRDVKNTKVLSSRDRYLRKTVTRRKKPSDNNSSGGGGSGRGGGGGVTRGGHSHSGSTRSF